MGDVLQLAAEQPKISGEAVAISKASSPLSFSDPQERAVYIVQLAEEAVASYKGGIGRFAATAAVATGGGRFDANSQASRAYAKHLKKQQGAFVEASERGIGRRVTVPFTYQHVFNGLAMELTASEAAMVASLPDVAGIERERFETMLTDDGPFLIGAPDIWDGVTGFPASKGEGAVIAVLDSGINFDHPSFADIGGDGFDHTNPLGSKNYIPGSHCDIPYPSICNDKLIGAWSFVKALEDPTSPGDSDGHGSHTASTAAGNVIDPATIFAPTTSLSSPISGVAPHANIIVYDVCVVNCPSSGLLAAVEQVLIDSAAIPGGIHALNFSISGGDDPYNDAVELGFLNLVAAGIYVAASAGNSGPGAETTGHNSPWVSSTGASTHRRSLVASIINLGSDGASLGDLHGAAFAAGYGPAPIVHAADFPTANGSDNDTDPARCLDPFPPGHFSGEIVVCDRSYKNRFNVVANVLAGGAGGLVLANIDVYGESIFAEPHHLPAVHIGAAAGDLLRAWLASETNTVATLSGFSVEISQDSADIMAGFSSRGPFTGFDIIKPDVSAPGVDIFAATSFTPGLPPAVFQLLSGTSMASPHHAGAAALLSILQPGWTPPQIKSALMMTAHKPGDMLKEDGTSIADPFDAGAGRIDVSRASNAGLVLDESQADFSAANPAFGGDPRTLNIASMANSACVGNCSWTRTVTNSLDAQGEWQASVADKNGVTFGVNPSLLSLAPGASTDVTVTANTALAAPGYTFSELVLSPQFPGEMLHMPIAVQPQASTLPAVFSKTVDLTEANEGDILNYQISVVNGPYTGLIEIADEIPAGMSYVPGSASSVITDGIEITPPTVTGSTLSWSGRLDQPMINVISAPSPFGYVSLARLGVTPLAPPFFSDNGVLLISSLPTFTYHGVSYSEVIMSVNGTVEVGTVSDSTFVSASAPRLPDPDPFQPNNLLAPLWADLDVTNAGNLYAAVLTNSVKPFIVFEWENVPQAGNLKNSYTFQVWIEAGTDNIWYIYAGISSTDIRMTVGAENVDGTVGDSYFHNSNGSRPQGIPPIVGTDLKVISTPFNDGTLNISFQAQVGLCRDGTGAKVNYAQLMSSGQTETAIAGTACDIDKDGDGVFNHDDNCPDDFNPMQEDFDGDGVGYACDLRCASGMDFVHDFSNGDMFVLQASGPIAYKGLIPNGADITFDAGTGIDLKNGTSIGFGGLLTILTAGCAPFPN